LISFPGCVSPCISILMCMYFLFMHSQGGRLYIHTNTGQVLCLLLWLPNGLSLLVLAPNLMFLGSSPKLRYSASNSFHWLASKGCVSTGFSFHSGSFSTASFLSPCQRMSFASMRSAKYHCRRGMSGKYHTTFRGAFFPFLYRAASHTGHVVLSACSFR
jgi:hypothetical protein